MRAWRDHHSCSEADIAELVELRRQHAAAAFLTTEKDRVRLTPEALRQLEAAAPVHVGQLRVRLRDEIAAMDQLYALLPGAVRSPNLDAGAPSGA
jgi:tetraacyldisaccharide-1-P 4'-kinase